MSEKGTTKREAMIGWLWRFNLSSKAMRTQKGFYKRSQIKKRLPANSDGELRVIPHDTVVFAKTSAKFFWPAITKFDGKGNALVKLFGVEQESGSKAWKRVHKVRAYDSVTKNILLQHYLIQTEKERFLYGCKQADQYLMSLKV